MPGKSQAFFFVFLLLVVKKVENFFKSVRRLKRGAHRDIFAQSNYFYQNKKKRNENMKNKTTNTTSKTIERQNHRKAWAYFEAHGYANHSKMVLHHADPSMKTRDPERYA